MPFRRSRRHTLPNRLVPILLSGLLAGCSTTSGPRLGSASPAKSIAVVGDRSMPATVGEPGSKVAADVVEPEPRLNPRARISGRVVDERGRPVPDAVVRLADGAAKGGRDIRALTDESGGFTLNGLRPGSTYWIVAEGDGDTGRLTGRVQAMTAETGVEIALGNDAPPTGSSRRQSTASRAKPISNVEDLDQPPAADANPKVNGEDIGPPEAADELDPGPAPRSRPRLSPPEAVGGWKNSQSARSNPAPDATVAARPRKAANPQPVDTNPADDDGPNPLPPAIDSGPDDPGANPTPAPRRRSTDDSGAMSNPPKAATGAIASANEPPPKPPAMPEFDPASAPVQVAELPPMIDPLAQTGPPTSTPVPTPTASPPDPAANPPIIAASPTPAPMPGFASPGVASPADPSPNPPSPSPAAEYNPFVLAAATATDPAPAPAPSPNPGPNEPNPTPTAAELDEKPTLKPAPKKKWGEVAAEEARATAKPTSNAGPARAMFATSLVKRLRGKVAPEGRDRDAPPATSTSTSTPTPAPSPTIPSAVASCGYDPRLRKLTDFRLPDLEGKPVRFQDLDADYVLLDFWGTWCPPCLEAIPHLVELQKQYGPGRFKVVGIACEDVPIEKRRQLVDDVARKQGINYPVLLSGMDGKPCPVQRMLQIQAFPTLILVDRMGQVVWRGTGTTAATLDRLDRVLASSLGRSEVARR